MKHPNPLEKNQGTCSQTRIRAGACPPTLETGSQAPQSAAACPPRYVDLLELHAREKLGKPNDWILYNYDAGPSEKVPEGMYRLEGQCVPLNSKGKPIWRKGDTSTIAVAWIGIKEHEEWCAQWSAQSGLCSKCAGRGEVAWKWSVANGTQYRACPHCAGTGKAPRPGNASLPTGPASPPQEEL